MIKGAIQEEDITIVNIYAPNVRAPQYIRQTLTDVKEEIASHTIITGDLTRHLHQQTAHQNRKLIMKQVLNDLLDEMDLIDIFRTSHPNVEEYTFISSAHEVLSRTDHMLGHKTNVNKVKNGMISSIFSEHKSVKLDINYKKKAEKIYKYVKAKQMLQCKN